MDANDIPTMAYHYLVCAEWSSTYGEHGDPIEDLGLAFSDEAEAKALADCTAFYGANAADLASMNAEQAGHDFWLTRNHHGAGFWDRGLGALGQRLTKAANAYGSAYVYADETSAALDIE